VDYLRWKSGSFEGGIFLMFVVTFGDYVFKNSNPRLGFASPRMASIAQ